MSSIYMPETDAQVAALKAQLSAFEDALKLQERILNRKTDARRTLTMSQPPAELQPLYDAAIAQFDCDIDALTLERARTEANIATLKSALQQAAGFMGALNLRNLKPRC